MIIWALVWPLPYTLWPKSPPTTEPRPVAAAEQETSA